MINKESKSWVWDFARQALVGSDLKDTEIIKTIDSSGATFNLPAQKIHVFQLSDGSTVLGVDQFHCDIDNASVLIFLSDSGFIRKMITIDPEKGWDKIWRIGPVTHDAVGVQLKVGGKPYFFDLEGNRVKFSETTPVWDQLISFDNHFIGVYADRIVKLDSNMTEMEYQILSDSILHTYILNGNNILVLTEFTMYILNEQLEMLYSNSHVSDITSGREINDRIWIGSKNGLYEVDTQLNVLHFYPGNTYEQIKWIGDWRDSLLIITQYDGLDHTEIGLKKFSLQDNIRLSGTDISITRITIPPDQHKVRSLYCPTFPGVHFDSLMITVINHSEEVVNEFSIGCDFGGPGQCISFQKVWLVDTISLMPHQSIDIFIDSFTMNCVFPQELCAWTFSPNDVPDANPVNDKFCDTIHILNTNPPVENKLINTTHFDTYKSHQILPDGSIRFFFHSNYRYPEITYADLKPGQSLEEVKPKTVYVPDSDYWNWSSDGFVALPFADGSTLLMNTIYVCDVAVPAIVKINKDGGIDWFQNVNEELFLYRAVEIMFLDSNRIGIKNAYDGYMLIIDREGNMISFEEADFPYSNAIETLSGYVASKDNQLFILNTGFQIENTFTLADTVNRIWPQEGNEFIIKTGEKFYLLDSLLQLKTLAIGNAHYDVVWKSKDYYWAVDSLARHVDKFFPNFPSFLSRGIIPPGVNPIFGVTSGNNVFVLSEYINSVSKGILIYTGGSDNLHLRLQEDIGITNIFLPDTVRISRSPWPILSLWTYQFNSIGVEVTNFSLDTVYHYEIQSFYDLDCGACFESKKIWQINTPLAPGSTMSIPLGALNTRCVPSQNSPVCLTTVGPNARADQNVSNDIYCKAITSIIVSAEDVPSPVGVQIYPNPADDEINIQIEQPDISKLNGSILNSYGAQVESFTLTGERTVVSVKNLMDGMYFINLTNERGQHTWKKFVVIH